MTPSKSDDCLHLFTSTIRALYISDALDVLAAPAGAITRFRYEKAYVAEGLREGWKKRDSLVGKSVLVHFAIQHPAEFHLPSYIPLRDATVVGNFVEGRTYVVNFRLGSLRLAATTREVVDSAHANRDLGKPIVDYSSALRAALSIIDSPRPSALLSSSQRELLEPVTKDPERLEQEQSSDFERSIKLVNQALYFSPRIFYRVAGVFSPNRQEVALQEGRLELTAGTRYEIEISHYQPDPPPDGTNLRVSVPTGITLIGNSDLPLSSRYDVIPLEIYAEFRDDQIEGQLDITVIPPMQGPSVHIPIVIKPSTFASVVVPGAAAAAGVGTAVGSILGASGSLKIALATAGTALASAAVMYRRARRLP